MPQPDLSTISQAAVTLQRVIIIVELLLQCRLDIRGHAYSGLTSEQDCCNTQRDMPLFLYHSTALGCVFVRI